MLHKRRTSQRPTCTSSLAQNSKLFFACRTNAEIRGHNTSYGGLRNFDGRPPFCGFRTRPTVASKCSTNVALPSGRPVHPASRKTRSSSSRVAQTPKSGDTILVMEVCVTLMDGRLSAVSERDQRSPPNAPQTSHFPAADLYIQPRAKLEALLRVSHKRRNPGTQY